METQAQPSQSSPAQPVAQTAPAPAQSAATPAAPFPPKKSSKMGLILVIIVLLVLAVAGWFAYSYFMNKSSDSMYQGAYKDKKVSPTVVPTVGAVKSGDTQLDQQSNAIDESMKKVEEDVNGVDTGLNDQAVDLSQ